MSEENLQDQSDLNEVNESAESNPIAESSASESLQDAVEEAIESGASKQQIQNMVREFNLKVNGKRVHFCFVCQNNWCYFMFFSSINMFKIYLCVSFFLVVFIFIVVFPFFNLF